MHEEVEGASLVEQRQESHAARDLADDVLDLLRDSLFRLSGLLRAVAACLGHFSHGR